jgi:hypothetical protein
MLISVAMLGLFFILAACGSVEFRWDHIFNLIGVSAWILAGLVWIVWVGHLGFILLRLDFRWWLLWMGLVPASFAVGRCASEFGQYARTREIQRAVDAGLHEDCVRLLRQWPVKKGGTCESRIFSTAPEFSGLPESIRMLKPVYVTNDNMDNPNIPPNIGICKNGFGGFAVGIRVFRSDEDARDFMKYMRGGGGERIAPGVYYWWYPT